MTDYVVALGQRTSLPSQHTEFITPLTTPFPHHNHDLPPTITSITSALACLENDRQGYFSADETKGAPSSIQVGNMNK